MGSILIVDDEAIIATELSERLTRLGYVVIGKANSGVDAIRVAKLKKPDLILMDIVMPGEIDGIDAAKEILKFSDVPIIFLTAYSDEITIDRAKEVAIYNYIIKPFQDEQLHATIEIAFHKFRNKKNAKMMEFENKRSNNNHIYLSISEAKIAKLIRKGQSNKEIAILLNVSERTVETHRLNIRKKLNLNNRKQNLYIALQSADISNTNPHKR